MTASMRSGPPVMEEARFSNSRCSGRRRLNQQVVMLSGCRFLRVLELYLQIVRDYAGINYVGLDKIQVLGLGV